MSVDERDERGFSLMELTVVCALLGIITTMVFGFVISANKAVATGSGRATNNASAQTAISMLEANIKYASAAAISTDGSTLWVANNGNGQPACETWQFSGAILRRGTTSSPSSWSTVLASGVSSGSFSGQTGYAGLVGVHFVYNSTAYATAGVEIAQAVAAQNMSASVAATGSLPC